MVNAEPVGVNEVIVVVAVAVNVAVDVAVCDTTVGEKSTVAPESDCPDVKIPKPRSAPSLVPFFVPR
jgi:hypothetical protein